MTTIALATGNPLTSSTDALVVALTPAKGKRPDVVSPRIAPAQCARLADAFAAVGATGKVGDLTRVPGGNGVKAPVVVGVGIGAGDWDAEATMRAVGSAVRSLAGTRRVAISLPLADDEQLVAVAMAALLAAYDFTAHRGKSSKGRPAPVRSITLLLAGTPTPEQRRAVKEVSAVADGVLLARDLVNTPPSHLHPAELADAAVAAVADLPVKVTVWDVPDLERDGCGGILAVGMGSAHAPRLVRMEYAPKGAHAHLALVGKGITFDTGGISIKPAANMDEMKADMAGAAAVIGAVQAIARLALPVRVTGWVPTAENMPSGTAQRPGDIITVFDGTTVEVLNTDAEGRLILADALGMAVAQEPDLIIDAATLTGAQRIALGARIAGVMSNSDEARTRVCAAAESAGESAWPMPLPADLRASLDSAVADIANIGDRLGGMLSAGVFLREFIPDRQPWVHMDIAGPAFNEKGAYGYTPKGGTGAAVRTFVQVAAEMAEGSV
jgi:leucyl aminopeptidase